MNTKVQRMQKRLAELLSTQEKHLKKAQYAGEIANQLKKDILFEENNAIAMKFRDLGIPPEEFDAVIAHYLSQRKNDAAMTEETPETQPEVSPSEKTEEMKEDLSNDDLE